MLKGGGGARLCWTLCRAGPLQTVEIDVAGNFGDTDMTDTWPKIPTVGERSAIVVAAEQKHKAYAMEVANNV